MPRTLSCAAAGVLLTALPTTATAALAASPIVTPLTGAGQASSRAFLPSADVVHTRAARSPRGGTQVVAVHVSPSGTGTSCTSTAPCSLDSGLAKVRATASSATTDINLVLHGGTYRRSDAITLGDADSGHNGHRVVWMAATNETPVIDGARTVSGWSAWSGRAGVYRAQVPVGTRSRQLYVDGTPADRASAPASQVLGTTAKATGGFTTTRSIAGWSNLSDAELVWTGAAGANVGWQAWTQRRCPIAGATSTSVSVSPECLALANPNGTQGVGLPTEVENNLTLLTKPGQFYLDSTGGYLYYMPRSGQVMASATSLLPTAQGLVRGSGVHDLTMQGITFAHDTWTGASGSKGFVDDQAAWYKTATWTLATPPGAVQFERSSRVRLDRLTVKQVGGAGIEIAGGSSDSLISNSVVSSTGSTGIIAGGVESSQTGDSGLLVQHNIVDHTGTAFRGAVGIFAGYVSNSTISHNRVQDVPYTGISLGWGWGSVTAQGDNRIEGNLVANVMQEPRLGDGGGIYVNGSSRGTNTIKGNHVTGDLKPYGAIYLDGASSRWSVTGNVISKSPVNWIYLQDVGGQDAVNNTVTGNWTDSGQAHYASNSTNTISGNLMNLTSWPSEAQAVMAAAG